ncbi:ABC transporter substrate-binding protein [Streptomyces sp. V3I7]|uniref:ABC transporter substrate-binding protein n=1 Tax=Streptomyces sp. V3I7 TaxID=3042278 RepID=UPI0027822A5C|nr:ABC transporter substrate-binding protein [Streptomyces sp. V3I7]MDQ0994660.1 outer membrane biosynthesis protein TonB [Streptomyces sp. V3I7]
MRQANIAAAVIGGYLLGRRKKAKVAIGLGLLLAGAGSRAEKLGKVLSQAPVLGVVNDRLREELTGAGKAAADTVLTAGAERLADVLRERTEELHDTGEGAGAKTRKAQKTGRTEETEPDEEEPDEEEPDEEEPDDEEPDDEEPDEEEPDAKPSRNRKPASASASGGEARRTRKTTGPRAKKTSASGTGKRSADHG